METLLLSGSIDFSTPAEFATRELLPYLRNGKQIVLSECGHVGDVWGVHRKTTERLIAGFYNTGVPDTSTITYVPMDFRVSWGFPRLAKMMFTAGALAGITLVVGIFWLVKKLW